MSIRPCASHGSNHSVQSLLGTSPFPRVGSVVGLFLLVLCLLLPAPGPAFCADEIIIVSVSLDQVDKGDYFVTLTPDGDFLLKVDDLQGMGFQQLPEERSKVLGEDYLSLRSLPGVSFLFHEETLSLEIHADPALLPSQVLDLKNERRQDVIYPQDNSLFLNYGLDYSAGGEGLDYQGVNLSNELGVRYGNLLFLTNTLYSDTLDEQKFLRFMSSITYDRRDRMQRLVVGDFFASSGELGSRLNLGGVSFSKNYRIDPYYINYPLFDFSGLISQPSQVDLLVDGMRIRSEQFAPGEFQLENFQGLGGAQTVEVVIRDAMGRERRISVPFYFTDQILKRGLHEYSYNLGFLRSEFGQTNSHYTKPAFSGFHRYGVSDRLNLGLRGEAGDRVVNLGFQAAWKTGLLGLLRLESAVSHAPELEGTAGFVSYEYQNRRFRSRFALQGFSEGYRTLGDLSATSRKKLNLLAGVGYATPKYGSLALDIIRSTTHQGAKRQVVTLSWARRLWKQVYANVSLRHNQDDRDSYEAGVTLSWYLGQDSSLSAAVSRENGATSQVLEARKNTPNGQGTGWNVRAERSSNGSSKSYLLSSLVQQNARYASLRSDFSMGQSDTINTEDLRLSVAGALVYIGDSFALTRPVNDSFTLVSVGAAEGVGVSVNGQLSGKTNRQGRLVVPELSSYYENQVSIADKDIPLDYLMPRVRQFLSPPLRSGSCINFPLRRYQAFSGNLVLETGDEKVPIADAELTLDTGEGPLSFWTGAAGEFYFDSQQVEVDPLSQQGCAALTRFSGDVLPAGAYPLRVHQGDRTFNSELTIPASSEALTELGEILLPVPESALHKEGTQSAPAESSTTGEDPAGQLPTPLPGRSGEPSVGTSSAVRPPDTAVTPTEPAAVALIVPVTTAAKPQKKSEPTPGPVVHEVIHFPFDQTNPIPEDVPQLAAVAVYLKTHQNAQLTIEGHTDLQGSNVYNERLGWRRAEAIRSYLLASGVVPESIKRLISYGERLPICQSKDDSCMQRNRRVVLIVEQKGKN
jgi:outer membrane usher protein